MKKLVYILIINILIVSCNEQNEFIENVPVNEMIDLSLPAYSDITTTGNSIFTSGGVKGLIIYRNVGNSYKIYDRSCSYEPELNCARIDSINSGIGYCNCCNSAFLINSAGEAINSPAILPLKTYNWSLNGNILRIFN